MHFCFVEWEKEKGEFDKMDEEYSSAIEYLDVLKTLLFEKDVDVEVKSLTNAHKLKKTSKLNNYVVDNMIDHIIDTLDKTDYLQMNDKIITELLTKFNFFDEWKEKFGFNDCAGNDPLMIESFKKDFDVQQITTRENISLKYIETLQYIISQHYKRLTGNKNKRINPLLGDDYSKESVQSHCHVLIQKLSFLLRIDEFLEFHDQENIRNISLSNKNCEFIYDYLNFFGIYYFEKEKQSIDNTYTSSKSKLIRSCFNSFFKSKANEIPISKITPFIENINKYKAIIEI